MEKSETILWVGKLPRDITHTELEKEFSRFGKIFEISIRKYFNFVLIELVDMLLSSTKAQRMQKQLTMKWRCI